MGTQNFGSLASLSLEGIFSVLFYIILVVALIMSLVFLYHWLKYNISAFRMLIVLGIYGIGLFFLLTTAYGFLLSM